MYAIRSYYGVHVRAPCKHEHGPESPYATGKGDYARSKEPASGHGKGYVPESLELP